MEGFQMDIKPILFSTPMVQAILEGRKTQTRRIIKSRHESGLFRIGKANDATITEITSLDWDERPKNDTTNDIKPIANIGDILWVRETWKPGSWREDGRVAIDYKASPELTHTPWIYLKGFERYFQKWTDELLKNGSVPDETGIHHWYAGKSPLSWKPSIFMPKEASRIFLEVTNVRVEVLQAISEAESIFEGVQLFDTNLYKDYENKHNYLSHARISFASLWDSINGFDSWESNPWVWVYEFKVVEKLKGFT